MSRTIAEITASLYAEKAARPALNGLTSTSSTAIWKLIFDILAIAIYVHEQIFDLFIIEVEEAEAKAYVGTGPWCRDKALEFQYGDSLSTVPPFIYDPVDETKKIVQRSAAVETASGVSIRVAKVDALTGIPEALSAPEFTAFKDYFNRIKIAGVTHNYITTDPDTLSLTGNVYVDPSVIAPDGSLVADPAIFPIKDALELYLARLDDKGRIWASEIDDALQGVPGVLYPGVITLRSAPAGSGLVVFSEFYVTFSGYAALELPLALTYLPAP